MAAAPAAAPPAAAPVLLVPLPARPTEWEPKAALACPLHVTLDAAVVQDSATGEMRIDVKSALVLDGLVDEPLRRALLQAVGGEAADPPREAPRGEAAAAAEGDATAAEASGAELSEFDAAEHLPAELWARETRDRADMPPSWGLRGAALDALRADPPDAFLELAARIQKIYAPHAVVCWMPSDAIQRADDGSGSESGSEGGSGGGSEGGQAEERDSVAARGAEAGAAAGAAAAARTGGGCGAPPRSGCTPRGSGRPDVDCDAVVANACVYGDCFQWHVDADPASFPESTWTDAFGRYFNREAAKPRLISLLIYLNADWPEEYDGETLMLDGATGTGLLVRPAPGRALVMDQDVTHRASTPSQLARGRPRFSLVWKLCLWRTAFSAKPGSAGSGVAAGAGAVSEPPALARPEWGPPAAFGSARKAEAVRAALQREAAGARKRPATAAEGADAAAPAMKEPRANGGS